MTDNTLSIEMQELADKHASGKGRRKLFDYIKRKISNEDDAEDILQDVFYQFWNTLREGPIEQAGAWLYRVAENKIIDWYRKKKPVSLDAMNEFSTKDEDDSILVRLEDSLTDLAELPDELLSRASFWEILNAALADLPEEQRQVFEMYEIQGLSFKEIEKETGVPLNTLLSRKHYAILFLRKRLRELYDEYLY
jgi:RNA polymerase sigma factor (sigma-70 family)